MVLWRSLPSCLAFLLLLGLAAPLRADEPEAGKGPETLTIRVGEADLALPALREREQAVRADLAKINETPATDPEERKRVTEPRATLAEALKTAGDLMERLAGAQDRAAALQDEIEKGRAALDTLRQEEAKEVTVDGAVDEARVKTLEGESAKAAQDVTNATEAFARREEALQKRQKEFEGIAGRLTELKTRADELAASLAGAAEDAALKRELLLLQIETNQVRKGIADLNQAHHVVLVQLDTLRKDRAQLDIGTAKARQAQADAKLAAARTAYEKALAEEAERRKKEAEAKADALLTEKVAGSPAGKAIAALELLVARMRSGRTEDQERISRFKTLGDQAAELATTAAARSESVQLLFPEGESLESWQREQLVVQRRQHEQDAEELSRFRSANVQDLNATLATVLTDRGRLEILGHRLKSAQDRIALGESDEARLVAIEREFEATRDEDYRLWLEARRDFLQGQKLLLEEQSRSEGREDESTASQNALARLKARLAKLRDQWRDNTDELKRLVGARTEALQQVRTMVQDLRKALTETENALDARRRHLGTVAFWLREPSLFSGETLAAVRAEAESVPSRLGRASGHVAAALRRIAEGDEGTRRNVFAVVVCALLALFLGLRLRGRIRRADVLRLPVVALDRRGRARRVLGAVYDAAWLPAILLAGAVYAWFQIFDRDILGTALVALLLVWAVRGLARGVNRAFFAVDPDGRCLAGCAPATARLARRILRTLLVGTGLFLGLFLVLRAIDLPALARAAIFLWGCAALVLGALLVVRRDILLAFVPIQRGNILARNVRGLLRALWPLVVLLAGAILVLEALGYRTASAFYATRVFWCALALLAIGLVHALLRALLHRRLGVASSAEDGDEEGAAEPPRLELTARLLGGVLTAATLVGLALTVSWVFDLDRQNWAAIGALNMTGGESGTGLTLGKLVRALLIFWVGIGLARFIRDVVRSALRARKMHVGSRYVIRTLLFYTLVTIGTLVALSALGIELSQFGWFLTAAGVGIGFGLQEIISNFISGLILFFERPVQVGDVVSVGDVLGDVQQINIRSTVVRTRDGVAIIIPNKRLITEDVVNWSHGEQRTRVQIPFGVAYGSDVPLVVRILRQVASEESRILKRPAPDVNFKAFGESELEFVLFAWLATPDPTLRRQTTSAVNTRVDQLFREHGVEVPFPQRDLHLRSSDVELRGPVPEDPEAVGTPRA